jgi:hypothetical protein
MADEKLSEEVKDRLPLDGKIQQRGERRAGRVHEQRVLVADGVACGL